MNQLHGTPILVFATYRDPGDGGAGLLPRLSADASTERVDLHGLPAGAVGDMLLAAENHVQHILTKLGFSNRSQIAAWASTRS